MPTATVTYSDADGIVKSGDALTITATFSEAMVDSPAPKIALSGSNTLAAINMTKVSATSYTYLHTVGAGNGAATVALSIGTDTAGNVVTSAPTSGATFTVDNTVPINQDTVFASSVAKQGGVSVIIVSSADATNNVWFAPLGTTSFSVGAANKTTAGGTATSILAPATEGSYRLFVLDAAGNYSSASTAILTVDTTAPAVPAITSIAGDNLISNAEKAGIIVAGTAEANALVSVTLTNGLNSKTGTQQLTAGATAYSITLNGTTASPAALADGTITPSVTATDAAGNISVATATPTATQDIVAPNVPAIDLDAADDLGTSNSDNITSQTAGLTFSGTAEVGSTVQLYDGVLTVGSSAVATAGAYSIDLGLVEGVHSITAKGIDAAGNISIASSALSVTVDTTAPTVSNVLSTKADGTYKAGDVIVVTVTFSEVVDVVALGGTPYLTLETGATDTNAGYSSGTGTTVLTFNYTVQAGDISVDLNYTSTTALVLNGGTIKDPAGYNASLTLPALTSSNSLGTQKAIIIDTTAPAAPTGVTIAAGSGWNDNYISNTNKAVVKVSGAKSTDTAQIKIDIDDEDTFTASKTVTLTGLGTETTYADTTGIDVIAATALADGNIAVRITAYDAVGNTSTQTVLRTAGIFKKDIGAPSGGAISYNNEITQVTSTVITLNEGTDAVSGIGTRVIERKSAAYSNDLEGAYGAFGALWTAASGATTYTASVAEGNAYQYRYVITDTAGNSATYTSASIIKVVGATSKYTLSAPADITSGGSRAAYTVTRYDQNNNLVTFGAETVYLFTNSSGVNAAFKDAVTAGNTIISKQISSGSSTGNFWYYDEKAGNWMITAADVAPADGLTGVDDATDALTVGPASASKFKVIATNGASTMTAGGSVGITVTAYDAYGNVDTNYDYGPASPVSVTFSGASTSDSYPVSDLNTNNPTCADYGGTKKNFGVATLFAFTDGVSSPTFTMILKKAETAHIKATAGSLTTVDADDLDVTVSAGTASQLTWGTQYAAGDKVIKNAPWNTFKVNISDAYGNVASGSANITVTPAGGTAIAASTSTVASISGVATFTNFAVTCTSYPGSVTLVASSLGMASSAASNAVTIEENYNITYRIKDYNNAAVTLSGVTLSIKNSGTTEILKLSGNGVFNNISLPYDAAGYTFDASKDDGTYVPRGEIKIPNSGEDGVTDGFYNNAITWIGTLQSVIEATADYQVRSSFVYLEPVYQSDGVTLKSGTDQLNIRVWLERRGKTIVNTSVDKLGAATVDIYDDTTGVWTTITFDALTDDSALAETLRNGTFNKVISYIITTGTGKLLSLTAGKTYFVRCNVPWGGASSSSSIRNVYYSGATFTIPVTERLVEVTDTVKREVSGVLAKVALESAATQAAMALESVATKAKIASEAAATQAKITSEGLITQGKVGDVKTETAKILTASETTLPQKVKEARELLEATLRTDIKPHIKSHILNRETVVKTGETIIVSYQTVSGLSPTIDVYDSKNNLRVSKQAMTEKGTTGLYEYSLKFQTAWGKGDFTIVCSESTQGTVDALVLNAIPSSLEDISGQVSSIMGSTSGISSLKNVADNLNTQFGLLESSLGKLSKDVTAKAAEAAGAASELDTVYSQLTAISSQIKKLGASENVNLEKLLEVSQEKKEDMTYLKNKTQELKATMELTKKMTESVSKKPVVQTWFEFK